MRKMILVVSGREGGLLGVTMTMEERKLGNSTTGSRKNKKHIVLFKKKRS